MDMIYIHCVSFCAVGKSMRIKIVWKNGLKKMFCVVAHSSHLAAEI